MKDLAITVQGLEVEDVRPLIEELKPEWVIDQVQVKTFTEGTVNYHY